MPPHPSKLRRSLVLNSLIYCKIDVILQHYKNEKTRVPEAILLPPNIQSNTAGEKLLVIHQATDDYASFDQCYSTLKK